LKKTGATYGQQLIPLPVTTPEAFVESFWSAVTSQTKVIFLSHLTSPTALIFPVQEICQRARQAGIPTIIDGATHQGISSSTWKILGRIFTPVLAIIGGRHENKQIIIIFDQNKLPETFPGSLF